MRAIRKQPRAAPRRPGRPRADTNQRERLLDAAIACYTTQGVAATSLRSIALAAGVTPALVNYYFGSKERLLDAVVEERVMPAATALARRLETSGDEPRAIAAAFVRGMHDAVAERPWLPSLWVREILTENGALRPLLFERIAPLVPQPLVNRLAAARRRGKLGKELDPRLLVVSLMGLTMFPLAAAPIWRRAFDAADVDSTTLIRHTLALLDHGLGTSDED
jgi:TetR/AcrR family transcriptional regulator